MNALPAVLLSIIVDESSTGEKSVLHTLELLDQYKVRATFFISITWATRHPMLTRQLGMRHEIGAWGHYDAAKLKEISGARVYGLMMPVSELVDYVRLKESGFVYEAALPRSGVPRTLYLKDNCYVMPAALARFPFLRYILRKDQLVTALFTMGMLENHLGKWLRFLQKRGRYYTYVEWLQEQLAD